MGRKTTGDNIKNIIKKLRKEIPDVIIRTTVMVGFPGETKEDFEELYSFIKKENFDKLGAFSYSKEDGTPAARLKEQIHPMTKKSRYNKIMKVQQQSLIESRKRFIGKELKVIIEGLSKDRKYLIGRTYMDVPEIDGIVYVENYDIEQVKDLINKYKTCKIKKVTEYDLYADIK